MQPLRMNEGAAINILWSASDGNFDFCRIIAYYGKPGKVAAKILARGGKWKHGRRHGLTCARARSAAAIDLIGGAIAWRPRTQNLVILVRGCGAVR
jgi:hypothetical protein